jgi:hypothetical protein
MKLNPDELVVSSFETAESTADIVGPGGTYDPTPMTRCYWCPPPTIGTEPGTVVIVTQ